MLSDLLAWRDARLDRVELAYWRTTIGEEVDFVIETGGKLLPIEVKATAKPRLADCAQLRTFRQEYGRKARAGLLLHTGRTVEWITPDVLAVPWWSVLRGDASRNRTAGPVAGLRWLVQQALQKSNRRSAPRPWYGTTCGRCPGQYRPGSNDPRLAALASTASCTARGLRYDSACFNQP